METKPLNHLAFCLSRWVLLVTDQQHRLHPRPPQSVTKTENFEYAFFSFPFQLHPILIYLLPPFAFKYIYLFLNRRRGNDSSPPRYKSKTRRARESPSMARRRPPLQHINKSFTLKNSSAHTRASPSRKNSRNVRMYSSPSLYTLLTSSRYCLQSWPA